MKTKYNLILLVILSITMSCNNYLDINDDPNNPSAELVNPDLILAGALTQSYRTQARSMNILGNVMMNNWGANVNAFTGGFSEEFSLAIDNNFYSSIWEGLYLSTANFQEIIDNPDASYANHKAISKIMKSFYFQYLVDLYGDIPYSEAHLGIENLTPSYDDDEMIYKELITEIDEAIALIQSNTGVSVGAEDVVFNGSMTNWVVFANTLKLKMLLRQSTKAYDNGDTTLATYLDAQFADLEGSTFISTDVKINPGYSNGETAQQNPFYALMFSNDESTSVSYNFYRGSDYAIEYLKGNATGAVPDSRLTSLYGEDEDGSGSYTGHVQGQDGNNSPENLSPIGPGLVINSAQNGYIMTAAESYLMLAEAQLRGKLSGDPETSFNSGITASFNLLGSNQAGYNPSSPGLAWVGSDDDKLQAIMRQKWIATNGINAIESWIEFTRTGYPAGIPLATTSQSSTRPKRLLYPNSENISNSSNVPPLTSAEAFITGPFWAQ